MRIIDADALIMRVNGHGTNKFGVLHDVDIRAFINEQPTVDSVPVVRCGECKWFDRLEKNHPYGYCHAAKHGHMTSRWEISIYRKCKEDFYCADGERRSDEQQ